MRLSVSEICSMLRAYQAERGISFDRGELAEYWTKEGVRTAVREILKDTNTLFDDVVKNIENNAGFRRLVEGILLAFRDFMKAEYRKEDEAFIERQGRLLFLAFLKPVINGAGHYVVEPETRDSTRMDIVVFYGKREYILELKVWHGPKRFAEGVV